ncbi:MAG: c-type cytochrome [Flavobacteriales bacterium]|nr:c-type cytochrome [Flavobacteriales bacterium]
MYGKVVIATSIIILGLFACRQVHSQYHDFSVVTDDKSSLSDSLLAQVELGRFLFYEQLLSRDSSLSCGSCHMQNLAFTDGEKTSIGFKGQRISRNAPTLANAKDRTMLLLDGVNPSLEDQVLVPIAEHKEFDFHVLLIAERLKTIPKYVSLSQKAYHRLPDAYVITHSIAAFERTLISDNSAYDNYLRGDSLSLTASQYRGKDLFFNVLYCSECHTGPNLTNEGLSNNGLYLHYADSGRMRSSEKEIDRAIFRVPTLRNIMLTNPYMHDGGFSTIKDVIHHYSTGGKANPHKSEIIQPFNLTDEQTEDLIQFLHSLTDKSFINNKAFSNPNK